MIAYFTSMLYLIYGIGVKKFCAEVDDPATVLYCNVVNI